MKGLMHNIEPAGEAPERPAPVVLLVEDEIMIRLAEAESLRDAGMCVIEAGCGQDALVILSSPIQIDMLVTDVTMPGEPDGLGLAAQCRDLRPGIPILVATARPPDPVVVPAERILAKPFPVSELVSAVQELLRPLWQTSNDPKAS